MASLAAIANRTPTFKVEIFNTSYNPSDMTSLLYTNAGTTLSGWYQIPTSTTGMLRLKVDDSIYKKTTAEFEILQDEQWLYSLDTVSKRQSVFDYYPTSPDINVTSDGSKLIIMIDTTGDFLGSEDTEGTISITGTIDSVTGQTEVVTISGIGAYITENEFESIDTDGIDYTSLNCHAAVFGNVGTPNTRHEIKISCDANSDGVYGLMFAGYMMPVTNKVKQGQTTTSIKCTDYTEFLMSNEIILGNRAEYRCTHYDDTSPTASCSESGTGDAAIHWYETTAFTDANKICYIGDMNTHHPNGAVVPSADYICSAYSADATKPLPYCGYTCKTGYTLSSDPYWEPFPYTYTLAMNMIRKSTANLDSGIVSRQFDASIKGYATLQSNVSISATTISLLNYTGSIEVNDYVHVNEEFMKVTSVIGLPSYINVTKAAQNTVDSAHTATDIVKVYHIANTTYGSEDLDQLTESDVKSTIYKTGTKLAELMLSSSSVATFVFWVDKFKQLQITELNLANPGATSGGSGSALALSLNDITKVTSVQKGGVVNQVYAWVELSDTQPMYCMLNTDLIENDSDISDADYNTSIELFGIRSVELQNSQLNSVSIDEPNYIGFKTFAYNYLKQHAYPKFTQSIVVDSFVPDEHYWSVTDDEPYFTYTNEYNEHIDLLGRKINAPDFNLEDTPIKTFIIEEIHYNITEVGNFDTRLVMSRISEKGDY